jgi:GTP-binding protein
LADLVEEGQELVVALGGKPGKGNSRFASSVRQEPRMATKGTEGERRDLKLELKLFADVGLVGLPNAGKSTFLSVVTAATPKVADYPFTTLDPQVGIASLNEHQTLVIADLPGLVEGAAEGVGLGHRFLRHVERCRALLHLVDCSSSAIQSPVEAYETIRKELEEFSPVLAAKPQVLAASKVEGPEGEAAARELELAVGFPVRRLSSHTHQGLPEVLKELQGIVLESS